MAAATTKAAKPTADDVPRLLEEYVVQAAGETRGFHHDFDAKSLPAGAALLAASKAVAAVAATEALGRFRAAATESKSEEPPAVTPERRRALEEAVRELAAAEGIGEWDATKRLLAGEFADVLAAERAGARPASHLPAFLSDPHVGGVGALLDKLLRRALPLPSDALQLLAEEAAVVGVPKHDPSKKPGDRAWDATLFRYGNPFLCLAKQTEAFVKAHGEEALTDDLRDALRRAAVNARGKDSSYTPLKKYADALDDLAGPAAGAAAASAEPPPPDLPPEPEPTGDLLTLAPDGYEIREDDPLRPVQELFSEYLADVNRHFGRAPDALTADEAENDYFRWLEWRTTSSEAGRAVVEGPPADRAWALIAGLRRFRHLADRVAEARGRAVELYMDHGLVRALWSLLDGSYGGAKNGPTVTSGPILADRRAFVLLMEALADVRPHGYLLGACFDAISDARLREFLSNPSDRLREACRRVQVHRRTLEWDPVTGEAATLLAAAAEPAGPPLLDAGEAWSDAARAAVAGAADPAAWRAWLTHCGTASAAKPPAKWSKAAGERLDAVGRDAARAALADWFPLVDKPRTDPFPPSLADQNRRILPRHADVLKGLVWCAPLLAGGGDGGDLAGVARGLSSLALSAYRKEPGVGPRLVKVGNACVWALGQLPGRDAVGQLALLAVKVKFGTAQKQIDKALTAAAEREGLPREEIDELAVPSYGLELVTSQGADDGRVGLREELLGEFTARLAVTGTASTALSFVKPDGKAQKSVPAAVKRDFKEELGELKAAAKDVQKMLPAQRDRIDGLFLGRKTWDLPTWRARYWDHPLVGTLARRLIWRFTSPDGTTRDGAAVAGEDGTLSARLHDAAGEAFDPPADAAVSLWHPIEETVEAVTAWRRFYEDRGLSQPFKQAHREVYVLTDAERNTGVYSNRFAAQLVKQHQFKALGAQRGWKSPLRMMVDDEYPPATKDLPAFDLRAEFWVEGVGEEFGRDTTDSGAYLHLATDQVRFYPLGSAQRTAHAGGGGYSTGWRGGTDEPVPLAEVPPLVLSETLRDADLFVGVAGVGNDPTWTDGRSDGGTGDWTDRWHAASFGDLSATAATRKEVLQRLIPRLKIADRCDFGEKFLRVRGDLKTYKIHLGSGNILMEPNDRYLCIVPKSGAVEPGGVALPFEGDRTLSVILSKAFLLAADTQITDRTITSQING